MNGEQRREEGYKKAREGVKEGRRGREEEKKSLLFQLTTYGLVSYLYIYCHWKNVSPKQTSPSLSPCHILFPGYISHFLFRKCKRMLILFHKEHHQESKYQALLQDRLYRITQWRWILSFGFGGLSLLFFSLINAVVKK